MSGFFTKGETKTRPGTYHRYENAGSNVAGASDGVTAAVFKSAWGPVGSVITVDKDTYSSVFGAMADGLTIDLLSEIFTGGAASVPAVRLGTGGTKGTITLKDTNGTQANAITLTTKYVTNRAFQVMIRLALGDSSTKELLVYENNTLLEKLSFAVSASGEVDALIAAGASSIYFDFAKVESYAGNGVVATIAQTAVTSGANPTVTTSEYSAAFTALEPYTWNVIVTDSVDTAVHALVDAYIARVYENGKNSFAVVGEPKSIAIATRESHAAAFNRYNTLYVGGGWYENATLIDGYKAAGRIAGMVAATSSSNSITHATITGATDVAEKLTDAQYSTAIKSGMITFSTSADGSTVWVEDGVTTLITPSGNDDAGWKKIKRCKVRFELFTRTDGTLDKLIGKINVDSDGLVTALKAINDVLLAMISEGGKIQSGASVAVSNSAGDSAEFTFINVDDIDALEKAYLVHKFRFSKAA